MSLGSCYSQHTKTVSTDAMKGGKLPCIPKSDPILYVFEVNIGTAKFALPPKAERDLLQLVNFNKVPASLLISNSDFYPSEENFVPVIAEHSVTRRGILSAFFTDSGARTTDPIDIHFRFEARVYRRRWLSSSTPCGRTHLNGRPDRKCDVAYWGQA